jgi:hypothetical protein
MSTFTLLLGKFKSRSDHKDFVKSTYPLLDSFRELGVDFSNLFVKPDPAQELGIGMKVGAKVDASTTQKNQLQKLISDNKLPYTLEPVSGWEEATDVLPQPVWGKVKVLIESLFAEYRYAEDPALVIFIFRLEQAIERNDLDEFYKAMKAVMSKVTLPEDKMALLKEKLFLYNIYFFEV